MLEVNNFEADLLSILRCLMHRAPVDQVLGRLIKRQKEPRCLTSGCVNLVQDMLSKGTTAWLAEGGWTQERFMQDDTAVEGRLWNRHSIDDLQLLFTPNSLRFLIWLTADSFSDPKAEPAIDEQTISVGDRLFFLMAYGALRQTIGAPGMAKFSGFRSHGLIQLLYPQETGVIGKLRKPDFAFWCQMSQAWVLEALQLRLIENWISTETYKQKTNNDTEVRRIGSHQRKVLESLFQAVARAERRDLCRFVLQVGRRLSVSEAEARYSELHVSHLKLADRSRVYEAALAFWHSVDRLRHWTEEAQGIGFYDEEYQAAQLWKSEWERLEGDQLVTEARRIIRDVTPMRSPPTAAAE